MTDDVLNFTPLFAVGLTVYIRNARRELLLTKKLGRKFCKHTSFLIIDREGDLLFELKSATVTTL